MTEDTLYEPDELPALELPPMRCADSARMRGEPLQASAVPYRRFLLLEVPGPWGSSALDEKFIDAEVAKRLDYAAEETGTYVVLIRRPGRHPAPKPGDPKPELTWALADVSTGAGRVLWGTWRDPADLLDLDLRADIPDPAGTPGARRVALVCTNGKRDRCCAIQGRPVAAAIAEGTDWETWECTHLGGHRFAATMMLLPTGDMFGWLDPKSALEVVRHFDAGQLMLSHFRGRAGHPAPVQAAMHALAVRLGDFRMGTLRAYSLCRAPADNRWRGHPVDGADLWQVDIIHQAEGHPQTPYRVVMAESRLAPALMSCSDTCPQPETRYEALSFSRVLRQDN